MGAAEGWQGGWVLERPGLTDEAVAGFALDGWGLSASGVRFLPVGYDAAAWAFEVVAGGERFFLKVRRGTTGAAGARVARWLRDSRLDAVVAPLPTLRGTPWHRVDRGGSGEGYADGLVVLLYPMVDGDDLWQRGLTDEQWVELGATMAALHSVTLPAELAAAVRREDYECGAVARLRELPLLFASRAWDAGEARAQLVALWRERAGEIAELADRTERLGRLAAGAGLPMVVCHGDIHPGNLLADGPGRLHVVDWDDPLLAPRERDLMFVLGGVHYGEHRVSGHQESLFRTGYGPVDADPVVVAYFRHERVAEDLAEFAAGVLLREGTTERSRLDELRWFRAQFTSGEVAGLAAAGEPLLAGR